LKSSVSFFKKYFPKKKLIANTIIIPKKIDKTKLLESKNTNSPTNAPEKAEII